jgi:hypothetical protein
MKSRNYQPVVQRNGKVEFEYLKFTAPAKDSELFETLTAWMQDLGLRATVEALACRLTVDSYRAAQPAKGKV